MVSQYEQYFREECKIYNDIIKAYENRKLENLIGMDELRRKALVLASNFVTMKSNKDIIAQKIKTSKVQFGDWCYEKYRILMEMHTELCVDIAHSKNDLRQYGVL